MRFHDLSFKKLEKALRATLYGRFYVHIPLEEIPFDFTIEEDGHVIDTKDERKAQKRLNLLFSRHFPDMRYSLTGNRAVYVHKNSRIPLIGLNFIGIVDKGSNMLEIKPITGCNMDCSFCSVNEGPSSSKEVDFVVEREYLVQETAALLEKKDGSAFSIWINPHGEPLLYQPIVALAEDIAALPKVSEVHIITNGLLLTKELIDKLAGIRNCILNISVSTFSPTKAKEMVGAYAPKLFDMIGYAATRMPVILTPVYIASKNDSDVVDIIKWGKKHGCRVLIQKFCHNKMGRNPIKEQPWDDFFAQLARWEKETGMDLRPESTMVKTDELPKPFKRRDIIDVEIIAPGRMKRDRIGVAKDRSILVMNCDKDKGTEKVKITKASHNIYVASPLS